MLDNAARQLSIARHHLTVISWTVAVLLIVIVAAGCGQEAGTTVKGGAGQGYKRGGDCNPAPCAVGDGIEVLVKQVQRALPAGGATGSAPGQHRVKVTFTVKADANIGKDSPKGPEINPQELELIDAAGKTQEFSAGNDPDCAAFKPIQISAGHTVGPVSACFDAGGPANGSLKLRWAAGFLAAPLEIPLQ